MRVLRAALLVLTLLGILKPGTTPLYFRQFQASSKILDALR
jgi:hypothetical protein